MPALLALTALAACAGLAALARSASPLLAGFAYLVATYLAQGAFKELFEAAFLLGFALWLARAARAERGGELDGPASRSAVLAAGALYAYSWPGLAWLAGTRWLWGAARAVAPPRRAASARLGAALPAAGAAVLVALVLAAPGGSTGSSTSAAASAPSPSGAEPPRRWRAMPAAPTRRRSGRRGPEFDDDLGNLFGQISPLEAFGIWPSGDFRVAPGDGAVPALVFYLGALLGAVAPGARRRRRAGAAAETALLAALAAAAAIWLAARVGSTPYTAAKALLMVAPVAMLIAARGLLDPGFLARCREPAARARARPRRGVRRRARRSRARWRWRTRRSAPTSTRPASFELSDRFAGRSVLLLVPDDVLADQHGEEFYGWELREAGSFVDRARLERARHLRLRPGPPARRRRRGRGRPGG